MDQFGCRQMLGTTLRKEYRAGGVRVCRWHGGPGLVPIHSPTRDPSQCVCAGAGGGKPGELLSPTRAIWSAARGHQSGTVDTVPGHRQPVGWRRVTRCGCLGAHLSMEPRDGPTPQRCIRDAYQGLDVPGLALQHVCDRDHVCVSSVLDTKTRCPQDVVGKAQRVMRRMC